MILRAIVVVVVTTFLASATEFSPFEPPIALWHHEGYLFQRQDQCLSSQHFCPGANGNSGCCNTDSQCATDDAGHIACCPTGAACTGKLGGGAGTATSQSTMQATPTTQAASATNANGGSGAVANAYYPYYYLPTTYPNADHCTSAFSSCRSEFSKCTSSLEIGGNGVTVSGAGGGITAQPAVGAVSAGSICSSLSTKACYNLGLGNCPMYGTAAVTTGGGTFAAGNASPTMCAQSVYRVAVAVAVGVAGQAMR